MFFLGKNLVRRGKKSTKFVSLSYIITGKINITKDYIKRIFM